MAEKDQTESGKNGNRISRRSFIGGAAAEAAAAVGFGLRPGDRWSNHVYGNNGTAL